MRGPSPLSGTRVVDLTTFLAGPYATQLLSALGADVIKVERPNGGDPARSNPPYAGPDGIHFGERGAGDESLSSLKRNRGKKSIALDLSAEAGKSTLLRLLDRADVLVENFAPGTLTRFGLAPSWLLQRFRRLVVVSISGFGQTGPDSALPAYDLIVQARSGAMLVTGDADGPPLRSGVALGDLTAALYAVIGTLAALRARDASGLGQHVDVSMLDVLFALMMDEAPDVLERTGRPLRSGNRRTRLTPFNVYPTRDGYVALATATDEHWRAVLRAMGREDLIAEQAYPTLASRISNADAVDEVISRWSSSRTAQEAVAAFQREGVASAKVNSMSDVLRDPQLNARGMIAPIEHPTAGEIKGASTYALPLRFSRSPVGFGRAAPALDQDRGEVLGMIRDEQGGRGLVRANLASGPAAGGQRP